MSSEERSHIDLSENVSVRSMNAILWQAVNSGAGEGQMWGTNYAVQGLH